MSETGAAALRKRAGYTIAQADPAYGLLVTWKPSAFGPARLVDYAVASMNLVLTEAIHDQLDRLQDVDIRQPSVHRQDLTWVTDYLIGCHAAANPLGEVDNDLCVFTGSNECVGDLVHIRVEGGSLTP